MAIDNNNLEIRMDSYFTSNIYSCLISNWVKDLNKYSDRIY